MRFFPFLLLAVYAEKCTILDETKDRIYRAGMAALTEKLPTKLYSQKIIHLAFDHAEDLLTPPASCTENITHSWNDIPSSTGGVCCQTTGNNCVQLAIQALANESATTVHREEVLAGTADFTEANIQTAIASKDLLGLNITDITHIAMGYHLQDLTIWGAKLNDTSDVCDACETTLGDIRSVALDELVRQIAGTVTVDARLMHIAQLHADDLALQETTCTNKTHSWNTHPDDTAECCYVAATKDCVQMGLDFEFYTKLSNSVPQEIVEKNTTANFDELSIVEAVSRHALDFSGYQSIGVGVKDEYLVIWGADSSATTVPEYYVCDYTTSTTTSNPDSTTSGSHKVGYPFAIIAMIFAAMHINS